MELAGLEPATSWVRFRRSSQREPASLQRFSGGALGRRNISRNILHSVLQRETSHPLDDLGDDAALTQGAGQRKAGDTGTDQHTKRR